MRAIDWNSPETGISLARARARPFFETKRAQLTEEHPGEFIAIDCETGEDGVGGNKFLALLRLAKKIGTGRWHWVAVFHISHD